MRAARRRKGVEKGGKSGIIINTDAKGVQDVYYVGKINKDIYKCVTENIVTDEVIITDERIQHIKDRHPNDFEKFVNYISNAIEQPDYIVEANKPNTAVVLKIIEDVDKRIKLIVKIKSPSEPKDYKNSVISLWEIGDTTWRKMIKNKIILYKKE